MTAKPARISISRAFGLGAALALVIGTGAWLSTRPRRVDSPAPVTTLSAPSAEESALRERIRSAPADPAPRLALVSHLLEQRRNYDAYDAAVEAHAVMPESAAAKRLLAEAQFRTARQPEAVETLRPLARTTVIDRLQLAGYLARMGRRDQAANLLAQGPRLAAADGVAAAKVCMEAMHPEKAVEILRATVAQHPDAAELRSLYGFGLVLTGRYREAVPVLDAALELAPGMPTLHFYAGAARRLSGDQAKLKEAESHLASAAQAEPGNGLFLYELGVCRMALRDWAGAQGALEAAAALLQDVPEVHRDLAIVLEKRGGARPAALARAHYYRTVNDPAATARELRPLLARDPRDVEVGLLLASAEYAARSGPKATDLLEKLREREPARAEVLRAQLSLLKATRRWKDARAVVADLEKLAPGDPTLLTERAEVEHALGEFAEEEKARRQLCEREPSNPEYQYLLGQFLMLSSTRPDRFAAAEASLRRAVSLRPGFPGAHLALGSLLENNGRPAEAIPELRAALDAAPEERDALRALGRAYLKTGDRQRSDECFRLLRRLQARADEEARLETQMSEFAGREATPEYREYLRQRRKKLARFLFNSGLLQRSIMELEMLEHAYPRDAEVHTLLTRLYGHARRFQAQSEQRRLLKG